MIKDAAFFMFDELLIFLDLLGTFTFAVSGALAGAHRRMDVLGMWVLALATSTGGGTLRSLLTGDLPVPFLRDPLYVLIASVATVIVFFFQRRIASWYKPIQIFDAIGLGTFLVVGVSTSLGRGLSNWASLLMGIVTATFGGVIRDIFSARIPLLFTREIYATACLLGGLLYMGLLKFGLPSEAIVITSSMAVTVVRLFAIAQNWSLPKARG